MDIGSLTGQIEIEDQVSGILDQSIEHVKKWAEDFDGVLGEAAIGTAAVVAGVAAITAGIIAMGDHGSEINDVSSSLEHFSGSSEAAEENLKGLRDGVRGTIDDFILMRTESKLLSAGVKLNSEDFKTLGDAAFTLQNRGFGSTEQILQTLNQSMLTGRTRALQMMGVVVDLKAAETEFAASLGVQKNQLSAAGKAAADRQAILKALGSVVKDAGAQERDFGEQLQFAEATVKNWFDELSAAVAKSPAVNKALTDIGSALADAFGGSGEAAIETIVGWIDKFAQGVSTASTYIVPFVAGVKSATSYLIEHKDIVEKLVAVYAAWKIVGWIQAAVKAYQEWTVAVEGTSLAVKALEIAWEGLEFVTGTAVIVALGLALYELVTHWNDVKKAAVSAVEYIAGPAVDAWTALGKIIDYVANSALGSFIINAVELVTKLAGWAVIGTGIGLFELLKTAVLLSADAISALWNDAKMLWSLFKEDVLDNAVKGAQLLASAFGIDLKAAFNDAAAAYHFIIDPLIAGIKWLNEHLPSPTSVLAPSVTNIAPPAPAHPLSSSMGPVEDTTQTALNLLAEQNAADAATTSLKKHSEELVRSGSVSKEAQAAQKKLAEALAQQAGALIPLTDYEKQVAEENKNLGLSAAETAAILKGPTVSAIQLYLDNLKAMKDINTYITDAQKKFVDQQKKQAEEVAAAGTKTYADLLRATKEYHDKNDDLAKSGTDLEIAQLTRAHDAAIAKLGDRTEKTATLYDMAKTQIDAYYDHEMKKANLSADTLEERLREQGVLSHDALQKQANDSRTTYEQMAADPDKWSKTTIEHFRQVARAAQDAADGIIHPWQDAWKNIGAAVPGIIQQAFTGGGGALGAIRAGGSLVGSELGKGAVKSLTNSFPAFMGSGLGQMIGQAIPMIGAAIGPAIEGLIKLFGDHVGKDFKKRGKELGVQFSDGFLQQLRDDAKKYGGEVQALAIDLAGVIKEAGGLDTTNLSKYEGKLRDTFSLIETHQITIAQGSKVIQENWDQFVKAGTSGAGVLDAKLKETIQLSERFGVTSAAMTSYIQGQMDAANKGISTGITIASDALGAYDDLNQKQMDLRKQMSQTSDPAELKNLQSQLDETMKKLNQVGPLWDVVKIHSQESAAAISSTIIGAVANAEAAGMSFIDAVKAQQPAIEGLEKQFAATGYSGGEAFDFIKRELALATDEIAGPALQAISGYAAGLVGLNNAGQLNEDTFKGITSQISATEAALEATGKSHSDVMAAMQGDLQKVWELQQQNNYAVDEATQKLLDEAVASGSVGESHKSMGQQTVDALNKIEVAITALATGFGFLPPAADAAAKGIETSFKNVVGEGGTVPQMLENNKNDWGQWSSDIAQKGTDASTQITNDFGITVGEDGTLSQYLDQNTGKFNEWRTEVGASGTDAAQQVDAAVKQVVGPDGTVSAWLAQNPTVWASWRDSVSGLSDEAATAVSTQLGDVIAGGGSLDEWLNKNPDFWSKWKDQIRTISGDAADGVESEVGGVVGTGGSLQQKLIQSIKDWDAWKNAANHDADGLAYHITSALNQIPDKTIDVNFNVGDLNLPEALPQAEGGDYMVRKPTLFLAGEAGPERVTFSGANRTDMPWGSGEAPAGGTTVQKVEINLNGSYYGSLEALDQVLEKRVPTVLQKAGWKMERKAKQ